MRQRQYVMYFTSLLVRTSQPARRGGAQGPPLRGVRVFVTGTSPQMRRMLFAHGVRPPLVRYKQTIASAVAQAKSEKGEPVAEQA